MPNYIAKAKLWLSHECRVVEEGEKFTTVFPNGPKGKPMRLSANIEQIEAGDKSEESSDQPLV